MPTVLTQEEEGQLSPVVWSNHNFVFHKSPQPLILTRCKDSGLKLELSMLKEVQLICQVEDKYMATVCESQLMMWERIRLEELVASSLAYGQSHLRQLDWIVLSW